MIETTINGRWKLKLPKHRADRPEWKTGWEVERLNAMHEAIKPGMTVFDIGAEEGDMTALLGQWVGKGGSVLMFEPNPKVWPNIKAIWEANDIKALPSFFVGFAGDKTEYAADPGYDWPLCADGEVIGDHGFMNLSERPDIPSIRIDDVVGRTPNIISIDVEGSELRVLKGAEQTLIEENPIVFVSVHDAFMAQMHNEYAADLFNYMKALGYSYELLAYDHELHVRWEKK